LTKDSTTSLLWPGSKAAIVVGRQRGYILGKHYSIAFKKPEAKSTRQYPSQQLMHMYPERLDKSFSLSLVLRLSESRDIVAAAIDCVQSSASLLNLPAQDAIIGHLTQVHNLHEISDSYAPPFVSFEKDFASLSTWWRPDPLWCQRDGHGPSANSTNSSGLSHLFQEQTIYFKISCYVSALEYNLPSASDEAGGRNIVVVDRTPLRLEVVFVPLSASDEAGGRNIVVVMHTLGC